MKQRIYKYMVIYTTQNEKSTGISQTFVDLDRKIETKKDIELLEKDYLECNPKTRKAVLVNYFFLKG